MPPAPSSSHGLPLQRIYHSMAIIVFFFARQLHHLVLKTLKLESGILWQIISDKVALEGHTEGGMIYMSREQTPSKGGDKQTWPRKAPCSPSALAFFAPSLQIKSGIPRLGSCHIRGRITVSTSPHIILSGSAKNSSSNPTSSVIHQKEATAS